jgi:hypothetical protein
MLLLRFTLSLIGKNCLAGLAQNIIEQRKATLVDVFLHRIRADFAQGAAQGPIEIYAKDKTQY